MSIASYLKNEHRGCDMSFAKAEEEVLDNNWVAAIEKFEAFAHETLLHFKKEEEELFPAFELKSGNTEGPTKVMRFDHEYIRGLIGKMAEALENKDKDAYLSLAESIMILIQQHNMKEEQMLYAMCDALLPFNEKEDMIQKMESLEL